jgi:hypothetical protein
MSIRKFSVFMALIACFPGSHLPVAAEIAVNTADQTKLIPTIQITQPNPNDSALRLEARQAPLGQILKELAAKTGAVIHYSVLPEAPVTATCAGANIWQLMDCLVAKQVGMVTNKPEPGKPAEFWLLGTSVGSCKAMTVEPVAPQTQAAIKQQHQPTAAEQAEIDQGNQNQSNVLLEKFKKSKDKGDRAEALNNLVAVGKIDDFNVRNALEEAMMDKDASIRSQAVETLANIDKDNATDYLNKAMQDKSPEVRITALGKAGGQVQLLEQALSDSDKNVSQYAADMLAQLKKQAGR